MAQLLRTRIFHYLYPFSKFFWSQLKQKLFFCTITFPCSQMLFHLVDNLLLIDLILLIVFLSIEPDLGLRIRIIIIPHFIKYQSFMRKKDQLDKHSSDIINLNVKIENYPFNMKFLTYAFKTHSMLMTTPSKQIILLDLQKKQLTKSKINEKATACAYHQDLNLWFILTEMDSLIILSSHNQVISVMNNLTELHDAKQIYWINQHKYFIIVTSESTLKMRVNIETNVNSIKYLSSLIFSLKIQSCEMIFGGLDWNSKSKIQRKFKREQNSTLLKAVNYLHCWNSTQVSMYNLEEQDMKILKKLARRENPITDLTYSALNALFCIGNSTGNIKIYSLEDDKKKLIHQFEGHQKQVTSLILHKQDYLISGGLDHCVKIYNLKEFHEVYTLKINTLVTNLTFVNSHMMLCNREDYIKSSFVGSFHDALFAMQHLINHESVSINMLCNDKWMIANLTNQTAVAIDHKHHQNQFHILSPPNLGYLYQDNQQYIMYVQQGISFVNISPESKENFQLKKMIYAEKDQQYRQKMESKVLKTMNYSVIHDWKGIAYPIIITFCWAGRSVIYSWDNELKGHHNKTSELYIGFGTDRGFIFLLKNNDIKFTTKIYFHSAAIVMLGKIKQEEGVVVFGSICKQNQLIIWTLSENQPPNIRYSILLDQKYIYYRIFDGFLCTADKSGAIYFYKCKIENKTITMHSMQDRYNLQGHDSQVLSFSLLKLPNHPLLFLTCGSDNNIKIWSQNKILLCTIKMFNQIEYASWADSKSFDIIISHQGKLSLFKEHRFKDKLEKKIKHLEPDNLVNLDIKQHLRPQLRLLRKPTFLPPQVRFSDTREGFLHTPKSPSSPISPTRLSNKPKTIRLLRKQSRMGAQSQQRPLLSPKKVEQTKLVISQIRAEQDIRINIIDYDQVNLPRLYPIHKKQTKKIQKQKQNSRYNHRNSLQQIAKTKNLLSNFSKQKMLIPTTEQN